MARRAHILSTGLTDSSSCQPSSNDIGPDVAEKVAARCTNEQLGLYRI